MKIRFIKRPSSYHKIWTKTEKRYQKWDVLKVRMSDLQNWRLFRFWLFFYLGYGWSRERFPHKNHWHLNFGLRFWGSRGTTSGCLENKMCEMVKRSAMNVMILDAGGRMSCRRKRSASISEKGREKRNQKGESEPKRKKRTQRARSITSPESPSTW